ncbi:ArnT family glycosyltransferase [Rubritalea spongiae]|uniref:ArnT family glycosyltransferase n=1 Tax=Rubritalea spongiae TaxID=430797 RepID=A0ABW5E2H9_9BACT
MTPSSSQFDSGTFFRRSIFAVLLIGIFLLNTTFNFKGLTHSGGIDQAQVAREVAKGNGLTTQFVRPLAIQQLIDNQKEVNLEHMFETYHSPLNILVYAGILKMVGGDDPTNYLMQADDGFYFLDQVIAMTCATFFIISIGVNYLLISRIFDKKVASVVAIIMLFSEYMWQVTHSGLPQMLMLTLFSTAMYLSWRAVEAQEAERSPLVPALLSGFFFGLLALTHWMTLWIFIGYFIFATFYFRPRGVIAVALLAIISIFICGPLIFYYKHTGQLLGTAFHAIHGTESVFRIMETPGFNVKGLLGTTANEALLQASNIHNYLGGLIIAPAFFIALLHPFRRSSISLFRWNILVMWIFAAIGMAIYGLRNNAIDANQLHMLFAPLMMAYAVAMMSIIWSRCELSKQPGLLGNLHFVVIILVTAAPMILTVKNLDKASVRNASVAGIHAFSLNKTLAENTDETDIIVSDQPWAVAWYANRHAIWTPTSYANLEKVEELAQLANPISGIHASSMSYRGADIRSTWINQRDLTPLSYSVWFSFFTNSNSYLYQNNTEINALINPQTGRYPKPVYLSGLLEPSVYYTTQD